jgi:methionine biosynthesis protein MetW
MSVKDFENSRWRREDQKICFRHKATLDLVNSGTVLDLGSGDGLLLSLFREKGIVGKGLDISEEGVSKAKTKGLDISVHDFSAKLPFSDGTFDTVIMLDLLEHLYDPEFLLKEARRVSKRAVIVGVPNFSSLPARIQTLLGHVPENNHPKKGHIYWFNYFVLRDMLNRTDLSIVQMKTNTFLETRKFIGSFTCIAAKVFPNLFSLSFVVLAMKQ